MISDKELKELHEVIDAFADMRPDITMEEVVEHTYAIYARRRRWRIRLDKRDVWIGMFYNENMVYICPLPCVVISYVRPQRHDGRPRDNRAT
jgi:hypothetical protein